MSIITIDDVKFGSSVSDPSPSQKQVTGFQRANGWTMIFNEETGLLRVSNESGHVKLYPITNIKEMRPVVLTAETAIEYKRPTKAEREKRIVE